MMGLGKRISFGIWRRLQFMWFFHLELCKNWKVQLLPSITTGQRDFGEVCCTNWVLGYILTCHSYAAFFLGSGFLNLKPINWKTYLYNSSAALSLKTMFWVKKSATFYGICKYWPGMTNDLHVIFNHQNWCIILSTKCTWPIGTKKRKLCKFFTWFFILTSIINA